MSNLIGRNLKVLREANDLTQEQMSSYLGIGRSAYANYEAGEREAPLEVLERSASLLGCELELLFEEDVEAVGWEDYLSRGAIVVVEWPERAGGLVPPDARRVSFHYLPGEEKRIVRIVIGQ